MRTTVFALLFLSALWLAAVFADVPYLSGRVP